MVAHLWHALTARVDDAIYNYRSTNDKFLKYVYSVAQLGQPASGLKGFARIHSPSKASRPSAAKVAHQRRHSLDWGTPAERYHALAAH